MHRVAGYLGVTPSDLTAMPPAALQKLLAYYKVNTHWTERVEDLLLQLLYYTVNMNRGKDDPPIDIEKFRPVVARNGGGVGSKSGSKKQTVAQVQRAAAAYGQRLED